MSYNNNDYSLLLHSLLSSFLFLSLSLSGWSVYAYARISLINQSDPDNTHSRGTLHTDTHVCFIIMCVCVSIEISHWFSAKENDWGYVSFFPWKVILIIIIILLLLMS